MKLKNVLLVPVVIGLVAYGGIKGYLYYQVKQGLDRMAALSAPFVTLKYGGIDTSLRGVISVADIKLTPVGAPVGIDIDRAELKGRGVEFLLDVAGGFKMEQPPERLHLLMKRIRIPLGSDFAESFGFTASGQSPEMCSLGGILAQTGIEQLGFQQLIADAGLRYEYDQRAGEVNLFTDYALAGLASVRLEMGVTGVSQPGALMVGAVPQLGRMIIRYQMDQGYTQRVVDTCAAQAGLDRSAFIDTLFIDKGDHYLKNLGFVPGQGIRFVLRHLITQPGELVISLSPDGPINPAVLNAYKPQDLVRVLGVQVSINDQPISDLSFTLPEGSRELASLLGAPSQGDTAPITGQTKREPAPKRVSVRYITTPLDDLPRYLGRDVRILLNDRDTPQQGVLIAMKNNQLDVEQRLHGGRMTVYIPVQKIKRVEVLRREVVNSPE
ncbi:MAG: hypothetical protein OQL20_08885 [Sedimenticola sp.]|nr:hypothetical protein [Sedimenticola sp.]